MFHDTTPDATHMALGALRLLRPHDVVGERKIRMGRFFDGGYVMIDRFAGIEAAYSLGINDDVSWDMDMARRGIPIFQYDHTIERLPEEHPLFHWEKTQIGDHDGEGIATLASLIEKNGHSRATNMLLKCDIEMSEWRLLDITPNAVLQKFSQIVIELHNMAFLANWQDANNVRRALDNLTASHRVVHVHANNYAPWSIVGGVPVPNVLELTLMRCSDTELTLSQTTFPTELDMPCHSHASDLYLGNFAFA